MFKLNLHMPACNITISAT